MNKPIIISFYTNDWEYPKCANRLTEACKRFNLEYCIEERSSTKDYIANTAIKPFFIKDCILKFKRPVLWLDVDGLLLQDPNLNEIQEDFAATPYQNLNLQRDWAVSILYFNYTSKSLLFLDKWCANTVNGTDEAAFDLAWKELKSTISCKPLPLNYCFNKWRDSLDIPSDTVFCNMLSKFEDKMRRKNKVTGQIKDD